MIIVMHNYTNANSVKPGDSHTNSTTTITTTNSKNDNYGKFNRHQIIMPKLTKIPFLWNSYTVLSSFLTRRTPVVERIFASFIQRVFSII